MFKFLPILTALALTTSAHAQMATTVSSPAFDKNIYREGAISQSDQVFDNWKLVCAQVNSLGQRFCNLTSIARDASGRVAAGMVVSTTDDGRPAAIIKVPIYTSLTDGLEINPSKTKKPSRKIPILSCDAATCTSVLALETADLKSLTESGMLKIRLKAFVAMPKGGFATWATQAQPIDISFNGQGFSQALSASQKLQ